MSRLFSKLSYANVVSSICLFVVLGGSAYAAATITGKNIKDNTVTSADVKNKSLLASDFKPGQLPNASGAGAGQQGPQGPKGDAGAPGAQGPAGPGAIRINDDRNADPATSQATLVPVQVGPWQVNTYCRVTSGRPYFLVIVKGGGGIARWVGVDNAQGQPATPITGGIGLQTSGDGVELFQKPADAGAWVGLGYTITLYNSSKTATVNLNAFVDNRGAPHCTAEGTAVVAG